MATKLTKWQADTLLAAYKKQQTDAANAAIAAYDAQVDADVSATERQVAADRKAAEQSAAASYDQLAVQAMIDRLRVAETLAGLGLARSGAADAAYDGIGRKRAVAERKTAQNTRAILSELSQKLVTARENAAAKKAKNAASVRKTLDGKVAEKRLTLTKATM